MAFRFVHTADWQLGKGFANIPGDAGAALRERRIETVRAIGQLATERSADAVLVAGDAFDANTVADRTLVRMLEAMKTFSGDWVFIPGNHDAALAVSVWSRLRNRELPANVNLVLEPEKQLPLADGQAVVLSAVLQRRHEIDDLTAWFGRAETPKQAIRIGLAHGSVRELLPGSSNAPNPIAANRADAAHLDYLALGDWHGTLKLNDRTWYSGTPETDSFSSSDPGNALVVTISESGALPEVEKTSMGHFAWLSEAVEVRSAEDIEALDRKIDSLAPDPRRCLLRLTLSGTVDLAIRAKLSERLDHWGALLHHLDVREDALANAPSDDDLDHIDREGFVRVAIERLRQRSLDDTDLDKDVAGMALVRLYEAHIRSAE